MPEKKNEARAHISNVDGAILEYYQVFVKQIKPLLPDHQLSDLYYSSEDQKND